MQALYNLRNHVDDFDLTEPQYFDINVEFNKKLEIYMTKLKSEISTKPQEFKPIKRIKLEYLEPENIATEESENQEKTPTITIDDLSKMIFGPGSPKINPQTEIFKPPLSTKRQNTEKEIPVEVEEQKEQSELCQIVVHRFGQTTTLPVKQIYFNNKNENISRDASPSPREEDISPIQVSK